jgi:hypothetical protein
MSKFIHGNFSAKHTGADRLENAGSFIKTRTPRIDSSRTLAGMLVAALVAALLVVANQVIDTITDGNLFAAWIGLWALGFAAMALLMDPVFAMVRQLRQAFAQWRTAQRLAAQDEKLWDLARHDARVMADIKSAMGRAAN